MARWARVHPKTNKLVEFSQVNPQGRYHPSIRWVQLPDHLAPFADTEYTAADDGTVSPPSVAYLRDQIRPRIAAKRREVETGTPIPVALDAGGELTVTADLQTRIAVDQALRLGADYEARNGDGAWQITWKAADGTFPTVTLPDLRRAWQAMGDHVQSAFRREAAINSAIDAARSPEGIVQVFKDEIGRGWPAPAESTDGSGDSGGSGGSGSSGGSGGDSGGSGGSGGSGSSGGDSGGSGS